VVQRRSGARLSPKTPQNGCLASKLFGKELRGYIATLVQVLCFVHNMTFPLLRRTVRNFGGRSRYPPEPAATCCRSRNYDR
jgi:hypothetical protein